MSIDVNQWTSKQRHFLLWLSLPGRYREPLTQQMLAKELGVAEETLCRWKKLPGFEDTRLQLIRASLSTEAHEVMGSFVDEAKKGEFQHQKLWMEMMGWYTPKFAPTTPDGTKPYSNLTDSELLSGLAAIFTAAGERATIAESSGSSPTLEHSGSLETEDPAG